MKKSYNAIVVQSLTAKVWWEHIAHETYCYHYTKPIHKMDYTKRVCTGTCCMQKNITPFSSKTIGRMFK